MIQRVLRAGSGGLAGEGGGVGVCGSAGNGGRASGHRNAIGAQQIIGKDMFEQQMEGRPVVMMPQMTEFMKQDIVAQDMRQPHDVQIQVYIVLSRAAAPVGGIVLDGQSIEYKSITYSQFVQTHRQFCLGTATEAGYFLG